MRLFGRTTGLVTVALVAGASAACDRFPQQERIGIGLSDDGQAVQIHYVSCNSEEVTAVRLEEADDPSTSREEDTVLWEVTAQDGSQLEVYAVGETPPGFDDRIPLEAEVPDGNVLVAVVEIGEGAAATRSFSWRDLDAGTVFAAVGEGQKADPQRFRERALQSCSDNR